MNDSANCFVVVSQKLWVGKMFDDQKLLNKLGFYCWAQKKELKLLYSMLLFVIKWWFHIFIPLSVFLHEKGFNVLNSKFCEKFNLNAIFF